MTIDSVVWTLNFLCLCFGIRYWIVSKARHFYIDRTY